MDHKYVALHVHTVNETEMYWRYLSQQELKQLCSHVVILPKIASFSTFSCYGELTVPFVVLDITQCMSGKFNFNFLKL